MSARFVKITREAGRLYSAEQKAERTAFVDGARWADLFPDEMTKAAISDKAIQNACEWVRVHGHKYTRIIDGVRITDFEALTADLWHTLRYKYGEGESCKK